LIGASAFAGLMNEVGGLATSTADDKAKNAAAALNFTPNSVLRCDVRPGAPRMLKIVQSKRFER